ncbi:Thymidylate synthase 1 [compost metagenome]
MNIDDAWDMALQPCVWHSQWLVKEGKLHLIVGIRSNDMALGNPFNVFQYYVLQRMVAQVTGYEVGSITFNINDAHVYERHIEPIQEQMQREGFEAPELWINPEIKNFDDFTIDDFKLIGYEFHPSIKMEVAI